MPSFVVIVPLRLFAFVFYVKDQSGESGRFATSCYKTKARSVCVWAQLATTHGTRRSLQFPIYVFHWLLRPLLLAILCFPSSLIFLPAPHGLTWHRNCNKTNEECKHLCCSVVLVECRRRLCCGLAKANAKPSANWCRMAMGDRGRERCALQSDGNSKPNRRWMEQEENISTNVDAILKCNYANKSHTKRDARWDYALPQRVRLCAVNRFVSFLVDAILISIDCENRNNGNGNNWTELK